MAELLSYTDEYGIFLVIFLLGNCFGYFITLSIRFTEIAVEVWKDGARDCVPFMVPPFGGPIKLASFATALGLTYYDSLSRGSDTYIFGIAAFLIGFAMIYNFVGDEKKKDRWLPSLYARLTVRRGQLKTFGQPGQSEKLAEFIERMETQYPHLAANKPKPRMKGPFSG
jgi:hypothetical protein